MNKKGSSSFDRTFPRYPMNQEEGAVGKEADLGEGRPPALRH